MCITFQLLNWISLTCHFFRAGITAENKASLARTDHDIHFCAHGASFKYRINVLTKL